VLVRLQSPNTEPLSFDKIIQIAFSIFEDLYKDAQSTLGSESIECLLAGYCPQQNCIKVYKFYEQCNDSTNDGNPYIVYKEVLENDQDGFECIGSPAAQKELSAELNVVGVTDINVLRSLRRIIKLPSIQGVDGTVQFGEFEGGNDFKIKGVQDKQDGGIGYYVRGTDIEPHQFKNGSDLMISYKYIMPFEGEIEAELKEGLKDD